MKKIFILFCIFTFCFANYVLPVNATTYYHYPSYSNNGQLTNVITVENGKYIPPVQTVTTTQQVQYIQVPQQYIQSVHYTNNEPYAQTYQNLTPMYPQTITTIQPAVHTQTTITKQPIIVKEKPSKGETIATAIFGTLLIGGLITAAALSDGKHHGGKGHHGGHRR